MKCYKYCNVLVKSTLAKTSLKVIVNNCNDTEAIKSWARKAAWVDMKSYGDDDDV